MLEWLKDVHYPAEPSINWSEGLEIEARCIEPFFTLRCKVENAGSKYSPKYLVFEYEHQCLENDTLVLKNSFRLILPLEILRSRRSVESNEKFKEEFGLVLERIDANYARLPRELVDAIEIFRTIYFPPES